MVSQFLLRRRMPSNRAIRKINSMLSSLSPSSSHTSSFAFELNTTQKLYKSTAAIDEDHHQHESETFLTGASSLYAEQMYENYQQDPNSVHETWRKYFEDLDSGKSYNPSAFNRPTVVTSTQKRVAGDVNASHLAVSFCFAGFVLNLYLYLHVTRVAVIV